ncbi:hypothetical protein KKB44_04705 [Candidatus Micrarchaeota archaeon]|nr:hypothetical protein [Candidatus Micrarchaeota archaeon]
MDIPIIYLKDKQVFRKEAHILKLLGKPIDVVKKLHADGYKLVHIVDMDALSGSSTNLDVYDALTYFINIQVECAPKIDLIHKLLSYRCRVVLVPSELDLSEIKEKNLLVAKISKNGEYHLDDFHDVILEEADDASIKKFKAKGKRVIVFDDYKGTQLVFGILTYSI